jgi:hypothetical protein
MRVVFYSLSVGLDFEVRDWGNEDEGAFWRNFGAPKVHR